MKFFSLLFLLPCLAQACPAGPYVYYANIIKAYDADTVTADIDLGFHTWRKGENLRLYGIDAPEVRGKSKPEGIAARNWLRSQILGKRIIIKTIKHKGRMRGKYGRYLAELYIKKDGKCVNLNDALVSRGMAVYRQY